MDKKEKLNVISLHKKVALGLSIITMIGTATPVSAYSNIRRLNTEISDSVASNKEKSLNVSVSLMKSDDSGYSMANAALVQTGTIIRRNGKNYIQLKFKPMTVDIITASLVDLYLNNGSEKTKINPIEDDNNGNKTYEIELENTNKDKVEIKISLTTTFKPMGEQSAKIVFDLSNVDLNQLKDEEKKDESKDDSKKEENKEQPSVDKDNKPSEDKEKDKKDESKQDDSKKEEDKDKDKEKDKKEEKKEVKKDKSQLENAIDRANRVDSEKYTYESLRKLNDELYSARVIYNDKNSTQDQIDKASRRLQSAISDVVLKNDDSNKNRTYKVPVSLIKADGSGYSMANGALNGTAIVEEKDGKFLYTVQFGSLTIGKLVGSVSNLSVYGGYGLSSGSNGTWSFYMDGKRDEVRISVTVDVMAQMGNGTNDAILRFNWGSASVTKEEARFNTPVPNKKVEMPKKVDEKKKEEAKKNEVKKVDNISKADARNFSDIKNRWAKSAIEYVVEKGYFTGTSATTFTPDRAITRGEFVTVLGRMLNIDKNKFNTNKFNDVNSTDFYAPYVAWAESVGITKGVGNGKFAPNKELTREEMTVMMTKFLEVSGKKFDKNQNSTFNDENKIASWAKDSVKEMSQMGIIKGMDDGSFAPKSPFTRAQVAQVLYNIDHK